MDWLLLFAQLTVGAMAMVPVAIWEVLSDRKLRLTFVLGVVEWIVLIWLVTKLIALIH